MRFHVGVSWQFGVVHSFIGLHVQTSKGIIFSTIINHVFRCLFSFPFSSVEDTVYHVIFCVSKFGIPAPETFGVA